MLPNSSHQQFMIQIIKEAFDIQINHPILVSPNCRLVRVSGMPSMRESTPAGMGHLARAPDVHSPCIVRAPLVYQSCPVDPLSRRHGSPGGAALRSKEFEATMTPWASIRDISARNIWYGGTLRSLEHLATPSAPSHGIVVNSVSVRLFDRLPHPLVFDNILSRKRPKPAHEPWDCDS